MVTLQERRIELGLTQTELSEKSGVPVTVIRGFEQGVRSVNRAQIDTLVNLCFALALRISEVLDDEELQKKCKEIEEYE